MLYVHRPIISLLIILMLIVPNAQLFDQPNRAAAAALNATALNATALNTAALSATAANSGLAVSRKVERRIEPELLDLILTGGPNVQYSVIILHKDKVNVEKFQDLSKRNSEKENN